MPLNTLKYFALLLTIFPAYLYAADSELPELGDSSTTLFSPEQERVIGREVLRYKVESGELKLLNDPIVDDYVEQVGLSLSAHAGYDQPFTFFVVDEPSLNAFALPGGYIGIHSGLILATRTENELAGVMAHEIAHVTQHHFTRSVEQNNKMQTPLQLAVVAAILLSGGDPNIINAAIASSLGGSAQMQINFTRAHEYEADRMGMQLLSSTDYDPHGMAAFFSRLQEELRYEGSAPEFLRTHPVTTTRISEAESAADHYPHKMRIDTTPYLIAKARIRLHHSKSAASLLKALDSKKAKEQGKDREINTYLRAIAHIALQQPDKAEPLLRMLLKSSPESIAYRATLGQLLFNEGRYSRAADLYREGLKRYPRNELLTLSLAENLIALKKYEEARSELKEILIFNPESASAYRLLGKLESENDNQAAAHLAQAERYRLLNEPFSALEQLRLARRVRNLDFYHASRIDALNSEIEESIARHQQLFNE